MKQIMKQNKLKSKWKIKRSGNACLAEHQEDKSTKPAAPDHLFFHRTRCGGRGVSAPGGPKRRPIVSITGCRGRTLRDVRSSFSQGTPPDDVVHSGRGDATEKMRGFSKVIDTTIRYSVVKLLTSLSVTPPFPSSAVTFQ